MKPYFKNEEIPGASRRGYHAYYYSESELVAKEIGLKNERIIFIESDEVVTTHDSWNTLVMNLDGKLYIDQKKKHPGGVTFHSSLSTGRPVLFAGEIIITEGKIQALSNKSGHYSPGLSYLLEFSLYMQDLGVLSEDLKLRDLTQEGTEIKITSLLDFIASDGDENRSREMLEIYYRYLGHDFLSFEMNGDSTRAVFQEHFHIVKSLSEIGPQGAANFIEYASTFYLGRLGPSLAVEIRNLIEKLVLDGYISEEVQEKILKNNPVLAKEKGPSTCIMGQLSKL